MLKEVLYVSQSADEPRRRWWASRTMDLCVWFRPDDSMLGFQLCYRTGREERALTWRSDTGYTHRRVDTGEDGPAGRAKMTPILVPDGIFQQQEVGDLFQAECAEVDPDIAAVVQDKIKTYQP